MDEKQNTQFIGTTIPSGSNKKDKDPTLAEKCPDEMSKEDVKKGEDAARKNREETAAKRKSDEEAAKK